MKQKSKGKQELPTGREPIKARILGLNSKTMRKMDLGEFCLLRESADAEGRRKMDHLLCIGAQKIVQEELAKARLRDAR